MMPVNPLQQTIPALFTAGKQHGQLSPSLTGQPAADMAGPFIIFCFTPGLCRQLDGALRHLVLALAGSTGEFFNCPPAAVTGCEIHPAVNPGWIAAEDLLHAAELLEDLPPVQQGQLAQAGKGIAAG